MDLINYAPTINVPDFVIKLYLPDSEKSYVDLNGLKVSHN